MYSQRSRMIPSLFSLVILASPVRPPSSPAPVPPLSTLEDCTCATSWTCNGDEYSGCPSVACDGDFSPWCEIDLPPNGVCVKSYPPFFETIMAQVVEADAGYWNSVGVYTSSQAMTFLEHPYRNWMYCDITAQQWTFVSPPSPPQSASASGDPHLELAHGGTADFRGTDGDYYVMLSSPGMQLSLQTNATDHLLKNEETNWVWKTVHGSFFTSATWIIRGQYTRSMYVLTVLTDGMLIFNASSGEDFNVRSWSTWQHDGISVTIRVITTTVEANGWHTKIVRKPIYNLVSGSSPWRFDIEIHPNCPLFVPRYPHGIIGQSWDGNAQPRFGKTDVYNSSDNVVNTTAMAEGAIEGLASEYVLTSPSSTQFVYSRFDDDRNTSHLRDICQVRK